MDRAKQASLKKFIGRAAAHAKGGKLLDYLKKFKDPVHNFDPAKAKYTGDLPQMQKGKASLSRGVRTSIGNTADSISKLTKDLKGKSLLGGTKQIGKNMYNLGKSQVKGDLHKEVFDPVITRRGGKSYAKSKWTFGKDREIVGKTGRGSHIVRRRKLYDPLSVAAGGSGPAIGLGSYAFSDKEKSQGKRISNAAVDTALFSVSAPLGIGAALLREGPKKIKNKQKIKGEQ